MLTHILILYLTCGRVVKSKNLEVMFRWYFSLITQEIRKLGELSNLKLLNKAKSYIVQYHNLFSFNRKIRVKFPYFIVVIIELLKNKNKRHCLTSMAFFF